MPPFKNIPFRIIKELEKKNGLSYWEITKNIGSKKISPGLIQYHLTILLNEGIISKEGRKYFINFSPPNINIWFYKGTIILNLPNSEILFIGCEYYNICDCKKKTSESCRKIKELPKYILQPLAIV